MKAHSLIEWTAALLLSIGGMCANAAPASRALLIVADSAAASRPGASVGWADILPRFFDASKVDVVSFAHGGTSARYVVARGKWSNVLKGTKKGDLVLFEFSANESKPLETGLGSLPGTGDDSVEIPTAGGGHETVHSYGWYIHKMVNEAKEAGLVPIVLSSTLENRWKAGVPQFDTNFYDNWAKQVAEAAGVSFIDIRLQQRSVFEGLGRASSTRLFSEPKDTLHTNQYGALLVARCVVAGLKQVHEDAIGDCLSAEGRELKPIGPDPAGNFADDPASRSVHPDWPSVYLIGDAGVRVGRGDGTSGAWGWGDVLSTSLIKNGVNLRNHGNLDLGARGYFESNDWRRVQSQLRAGDILIIDFGYNDLVRKSGRLANWSISGSPTTDESGKQVYSFGWYLVSFATIADKAGAIPIFCSPLRFNPAVSASYDEKLLETRVWGQQIALANKLPYIDLLDSVPPEASKPGALGCSYADSEIALTRAAAEAVALRFVSMMRTNRDCALNRYLETAQPPAVRGAN